MKSILFLANNNIGAGLSGGDRIFLELARYWSIKSKVTILGSEETNNLINNYHVKVNFLLSSKTDNSSVVIHQIKRTISSVAYVFQHLHELKSYDYIYSVSDFYPDFVPAALIKILNRKTHWIAGYYLNAPNPFSLASPYNQTGQFLKGLIYFIGQIPTKIIIKLLANTVFITSEPDRKLFPHQKTIVIRGGVDISEAATKKILPKKYDAVFIGRLHPQKGVIELIDIWKKVVDQLPTAKLAVIGNGDLDKKMRQKISIYGLKKNISMLGFLDGTKKNQIFRQSKIVIHPAIYDSGGMAAAEAMAFGLPGVSFDLEALKTYYPQGMIKTKCFNLDEFTQNIIDLLSDKKLYQQYSRQARKLIFEQWNWQKQSQKIYKLAFSHV